MSDESSMAAYNARAFADACEEIRSLKAVAESQNRRIKALEEALEYSQLALEFLAPNREEGDIAFAAHERNSRLLTKKELRAVGVSSLEGDMGFAAYEDPPAYQPED
jgi:hypothetical protein